MPASDILQESLPRVTAVLGGSEDSHISEREIVDALRGCNYDVESAVSALLAREDHNGT